MKVISCLYSFNLFADRINRVFVPCLFICCFLQPSLAYSQPQVPEQLKEKLNVYALSHYDEKLYVHTSSEFYLPGETIWFKVYCVNGKNQQPSGLSKIAYVELLSPDKRIAFEGKIVLENGSGNGSFLIPSYLPSGNYLFRAHTRWMQNFSSDRFFNKSIAILNPDKKPDWPPTSFKKQLQVGLFPEGGSLVEGLESRVAIHVRDLYHKGVVCSGYVSDQDSNRVAEFHTGKFGMGNFKLTPGVGKQYKVFINDEAYEPVAEALSPAEPKGYVLSVSDKDNSSVRIIVESSTGLIGKSVFVVVHTNASIIQWFQLSPEKSSGEFEIEKSKFPKGLSSVTLFNQQGIPVAERLYFVKPDRVLPIQLATDAKEYGKRKKVMVQVSTADGGSMDAADLSLAVFRVDSASGLTMDFIDSYLSLSSELKGDLEDPSYFLRENEPGSNEVLENLLMTHGWRRFNWSDALNTDTTRMPKWIPEFAGHLVGARVVNKLSGQPAKGIRVYLTVPGKRFHLSSDLSDENGEVLFDVNKIYSRTQLILQTDYTKDSIYRVELINPYTEKTDSLWISPFRLTPDHLQALNEKIGFNEIFSTYAASRKQHFRYPNDVDSTPFYGYPDATYMLDDYTRFGTMEEVMREYVPEVVVRKNRDEFHYRTFNQPYKLVFEEDPLVLLDGVPIFRVNEIIAFDPLKIQKMEIVTRKFFQDGRAYYGIVTYYTYQGDLGGYQLNPNALLLDYDGLQLQRQFDAPIYENDSLSISHLPDYRSLLYWYPELATGKKGTTSASFFTSDLPGKYAVIVQGISKEGKAGHAIQWFDVR